ncbi:acyl-CoA dehydrogenase [Pseudorhodoferax sp.]|uniref:acyl-CoA dehydrogenase n=1 Tax=Pseudorhodoferax sp. TaxID=1993553 RepID=UPI002DD6AED8|nr:acyl-CoA dehydrogenase [Pseudorhodoferax sp.]
MDPKDAQTTLRRLLGRSTQRVDEVTAAPLAALAATLDRDDRPPLPGDAVPPLGHWLFFWPLAPTSGVERDGEAGRHADLLPPEWPQRQWTGGRLRFHHALHVGDEVLRQSRVLQAEPLPEGGARVTLLHEITNAQGLALAEEQEVVCRAAAARVGQPRQPAPAQADFARLLTPGAVLLFRYAALRFDSRAEHQAQVPPALLVTLALDLLQRARPAVQLLGLDFALLRAVPAGQPLRLGGRCDGPRHVALWAQDAAGLLALQLHAECGA